MFSASTHTNTKPNWDERSIFDRQRNLLTFGHKRLVWDDIKQYPHETNSGRFCITNAEATWTEIFTAEWYRSLDVSPLFCFPLELRLFLLVLKIKKKIKIIFLKVVIKFISVKNLCALTSLKFFFFYSSIIKSLFKVYKKNKTLKLAWNLFTLFHLDYSSQNLSFKYMDEISAFSCNI